jgi:glycosyltransferase involved in cell wall biosynthesis
MKPFFTIILATYNRAEKIDKAIESVLNQTYTNYELIVVDDGSKDSTKTHVKKFSNVIYIKKKHGNVAQARNLGIKKAQGKYITFIDSDDWYKKNHLEHHYNIITKDNNTDFFYGGVKVRGSKFVPDFDHKGKKINVDKCKSCGTFFIKSTILKKVGGFPNLPFAEDYMLFKKFKSEGYKTKRLYKKTYVYDRTGSSSITKNF